MKLTDEQILEFAKLLHDRQCAKLTKHIQMPDRIDRMVWRMRMEIAMPPIRFNNCYAWITA